MTIFGSYLPGFFSSPRKWWRQRWLFKKIFHKRANQRDWVGFVDTFIISIFFISFAECCCKPVLFGRVLKIPFTPAPIHGTIFFVVSLKSFIHGGKKSKTWKVVVCFAPLFLTLYLLQAWNEHEKPTAAVGQIHREQPWSTPVRTDSVFF